MARRMHAERYTCRKIHAERYMQKDANDPSMQTVIIVVLKL